jgi:predicted nucleotide-binding protein
MAKAAALVEQVNGPDAEEIRKRAQMLAMSLSTYYTKGPAWGQALQIVEDVVAKLESGGYGTRGGNAAVERSATDVFVVHDHDEAAREGVARFLERLGLTAIVLHEQPNSGRHIMEKLERHKDVDFAVVLLTPDDVGASVREQESLKPRARQNVILELGYFLGALDQASR